MPSIKLLLLLLVHSTSPTKAKQTLALFLYLLRHNDNKKQCFNKFLLYYGKKEIRGETYF